MYSNRQRYWPGIPLAMELVSELGCKSIVIDVSNMSGKIAISTFRLPAKNDPAPPPNLGNFADIVYLKEQSFLHRIRDVCTL